MSKPYDQFCGAARALELVGDRWSLLLARELLTGPKRFTDLRRSLAGIPPNLLSERLRSLGAAGVVVRTTLPPPASSAAYELTEWGAGLRATMLALAEWGSPLLAERRPHDTLPASALIVGLEGAFDARASTDTELTIAFTVGAETATAHIDRGRLATAWGPTANHDVAVAAEPELFLAWVTGELTDAESIAQGLEVTGGIPTLKRVRRLFPYASP
jgi:DNA-binding HxlR family transcriptional regulator